MLFARETMFGFWEFTYPYWFGLDAKKIFNQFQDQTMFWVQICSIIVSTLQIKELLHQNLLFCFDNKTNIVGSNQQHTHKEQKTSSWKHITRHISFSAGPDVTLDSPKIIRCENWMGSPSSRCTTISHLRVQLLVRLLSQLGPFKQSLAWIPPKIQIYNMKENGHAIYQ